MTTKTRDLQAGPATLEFYVVEKIGEHQSLTPEGFLAVKDVPLCRTGMLVYGPGEVPVAAGPDGTVKIYRDPEDVFHPDHLASIVGKSVVNDHPYEDVRPENWKRYHVGTVLNPRRGDGVYADLLIGDLLIMDPDAIKAIQAGKREVSMGYDAEYEEVSPGIGKQHNLIANHVALVEAGRCGSRCSIKDHQPLNPQVGEEKMSLARKIAQKFKRVKLSDENVAALGEIMDVINAEGEEVADDLTSGESAAGDTHIHIHASGEPTITQGDEDPAAPSDVNTMDDEIAQVIAGITQRLDAIEQQLAKLATAEEQEVAQQAMGDEESEEEKAMADEVAEESSAPTTQDGKAVRDSRYLADSYQSTISGAEILAPGIRYPAFDSKARPAKTVMAVCDLRRRALDAAYMTADGRDIITSLTRGRAFDSLKLSCGEVRSMFLGAVTAKRAMNNSRKANDSTVVTTPAGPVLTPAELNKRNAAYWATH